MQCQEKMREPLCLNGRVATQGKISGFCRLFEPKWPFAGLIAGPHLPWVYEAAEVHLMPGSQFFKPRLKFSMIAVTAVPLSFGPQLESTLKELGFTAPALNLLGIVRWVLQGTSLLKLIPELHLHPGNVLTWGRFDLPGFVLLANRCVKWFLCTAFVPSSSTKCHYCLASLQSGVVVPVPVLPLPAKTSGLWVSLSVVSEEQRGLLLSALNSPASDCIGYEYEIGVQVQRNRSTEQTGSWYTSLSVCGGGQSTEGRADSASCVLKQSSSKHQNLWHLVLAEGWINASVVPQDKTDHILPHIVGYIG